MPGEQNSEGPPQIPHQKVSYAHVQMKTYYMGFGVSQFLVFLVHRSPKHVCNFSPPGLR